MRNGNQDTGLSTPRWHRELSGDGKEVRWTALPITSSVLLFLCWLPARTAEGARFPLPPELTNSNVSDPRALAIILEKAEANLRKNQHPDPYHREYLVQRGIVCGLANGLRDRAEPLLLLPSPDLEECMLTVSPHVPRRHQVGAQHPSQDVQRRGVAPLGTPLDNVKSTDACVGRHRLRTIRLTLIADNSDLTYPLARHRARQRCRTL